MARYTKIFKKDYVPPIRQKPATMPNARCYPYWLRLRKWLKNQQWNRGSFFNYIYNQPYYGDAQKGEPQNGTGNLGF